MKDASNIIKIMDIVTGTATNDDGMLLFLEIDKYLSIGQKVRLSMVGATPFSTSFLNSSIGDLIDKYGVEETRKMIVFADFTSVQLKYLKMYFDQILA